MKISPPSGSSPIQCQCILHNPMLGGGSRCIRLTPGPDVPFCEDCEDRHPEMPRLYVGVVPLPQGAPR